MKKLLSLPPNLVRMSNEGRTVFHAITGLPDNEYFCTCDPEGHRIGSGAGTAWLLWQCFEHEQTAATTPPSPYTATLSQSPQSPHPSAFLSWLSSEKRILLHAGGQSRRLPSYAPSGKILTPLPVFRWERGQRLSQDLLSLQLPLFEQMMEKAPEGLNTMVVSGDVLIRATQPLAPIPQADVVCYGLWLSADIAKDHGVFVADKRTPQVLKQMLQKPSVDELQALQKDHFYLTDIGIWLLSDRAVSLLMQRCMKADASEAQPSSHLSPLTSHLRYYDLYSDFGRTLGTDPILDDPELCQLSVAIVPLAGGEFYHFGTSREMISSTLAMQNVVSDQRRIMHNDRKPHPSIFVQNAVTKIPFTAENTNIWVENSCGGQHWTLTHDNIVTGVPQNDWAVSLAPGECLDVVPIGDDRYAVRRYRIDDRFDGAEQQRKQFPVVHYEEIESVLKTAPGKTVEDSSGTVGRTAGASSLLSAEEISSEANLARLFRQRDDFRRQNWPAEVVALAEEPRKIGFRRYFLSREER